MKNSNRKNLVVLLSVLFGIAVGLVLASNFNWTNNGLASQASAPASNSSNSPPQPINSDLESTSRAFVEIAKRVTPTVVSITSEKTVRVNSPFSNFFHKDDFFRRFFPDEGDGREYTQRGLGSGVIVSADGYILTNFHVVKDADQINVVIDRKEYDAQIVGNDAATDIAVIKIDAKNLPAATIGDSDKLEVGELVLAVGSPFDLRLQHTVTSGIISAKGRALNIGGELTYQDFIQTDAAINPGNSGGALVNIHGELIGINTAIYAGNTGGNLGIGFAIPINLASRVKDDLIAHGKVYRGYLGVWIATPDAELGEALNLKDNRGAVVNEVAKGSPADRAGIRKYDVIIEIEGKPIDDSQMLTNLIASYEPGATVNLKVIRDGKTRDVSVKLDERKEEAPAPTQLSQRNATSVEKLGLQVSELTRRLQDEFGYEGESGVVVTDVREGSPAAEKGLARGDLIREANRRSISSVRDFEQVIESISADDIVLLQVQRGNRNFFIAMRIPKS
jgi:serine protease Do